MQEGCQCPEANIKTCSQCTEFYCSNCLRLNFKEDYEDILISKDYCLQCIYAKIRQLLFVDNISLNTFKKCPSNTMQRINKVVRRHSWHGPIQNLINLEKIYFPKKVISEEERVLIHNLFLKKTDEFLLFFTVSYENILSFKSKIKDNFLSNDIANAYSYLIKFVSASLNTFNLWHEQLQGVEDILTKKLDSDLNVSPRKKMKYNLSLRKIENNETDITENANGTKLTHAIVRTDEHSTVTNINVIEENSNDSIYSCKTEAVVGNSRECERITESIDITKRLDAEGYNTEVDNSLASDLNTSNESFVFEINKSNSTVDKNEGDKHFRIINFLNENTSLDGTKYEICTENNLNEPLLSSENLNQKMNFLKSLDLTFKDENTSESEVELLQKECDMDNLLAYIEDEPFTMSEEESIIDDLEDQDSNEYIELPEGIYGKITNTLPSLPCVDDSNEMNKIPCNKYENYNLKPCSVVLEKIDETSLSYVDDKSLNLVPEEIYGNVSLNEEEEVERLINLTNLEKKRKHGFSEKTNKKKLKSGRNEFSLNAPELELDSDTSSENTNTLNFIENVDNLVNNNPSNTELLENLLNRIYNDEDDNYEAESETVNDGDNLTKTNKKSSDIDKNLCNKENETEKITSLFQELPVDNLKNDSKSNWKTDPLLVCSLQEKTEKNKTSFNISDLKGENILPEGLRNRILKLEARMLNNNNTKTVAHDPVDKDTIQGGAAKEIPNSPTIELANDDISDDEDVEAKYNKIIVNSESDSDIEFVSVVKNVKKKSNNDSYLDNTNDDNNSERRGRKNIREILDYETLTQATKEANLLERRRKNRLHQKHKHMDAILSMSQFSEDDDGIILDIDETTKSPNIMVNPTISKKLKPHQKAGVKFMWESCYEGVKQIKNGYAGSGCILAHCMGLGKTLQVITLIHTLFSHRVTNTNHVLVICPLSVVLHWKKEFDEAMKNIKEKLFKVFYICDKKINNLNKLYTVDKWRMDKGVLILGYECYHRLITPKNPDKVTLQESNISKALCDPGPDLIVLDEGHLIKNEHSVRSKSLRHLKTKRRIVLTGTPLQNNLLEYYYMIQFVKPNLLGSLPEYKNRFANPITNGQYHDSTEVDIIKMKKRSHVLNKLLKDTVQRFELSELVPYLKRRYDYALFIQLHPIQMDLYQKEAELAGRSASENISRKQIIGNYHKFRFIWSHPYMFHLKEIAAAAQRNGNEASSTLGVDDWWKGFCPPDSDININYGPKFKVMFSIIRECEKIGDKILVFSNSLLELNAIEHFLKQYSNSDSQWICNEDYIRMDGSTPIDKRVQLCDSFNDKNNVRKRVFLISNKVGGMGLNLIGANRVILMDVNWNPAYDSQSVFRIYRFGQEKECFVYRLVSMGTMEEVVYDRQVTKLAISGRVVDSLQITRHFKSNDLQMFYRPKFIRDQVRPTPPLPADCLLAKVLQNCNEIFRYHEHQSLLENLPDENLNEDEMKLAWDEFNKENENEIELQIKKKASNPATVAAVTTAAAAVLCQTSTGNSSNIITNTVLQLQHPTVTIESELPVASTSGTTTSVKQSSTNVSSNQRVAEPVKISNVVANRKYVTGTNSNIIINTVSPLVTSESKLPSGTTTLVKQPTTNVSSDQRVSEPIKISNVVANRKYVTGTNSNIIINTVSQLLSSESKLPSGTTTLVKQPTTNVSSDQRVSEPVKISNIVAPRKYVSSTNSNIITNSGSQLQRPPVASDPKLSVASTSGTSTLIKRFNTNVNSNQRVSEPVKTYNIVTNRKYAMGTKSNITNTVSQLQYPLVTSESKLPVASTSGTTTLVKQSSTSVSSDQRVSEPVKTSNILTNRKYAMGTNSNIITNTVSQLQYPLVTFESKLPVASTLGTTTLVKQSSTSGSNDQKVSEPVKLSNIMTNRKPVRRTNIFKPVTEASSTKKNIENNIKVVFKKATPLNNPRQISNNITQSLQNTISERSSVNYNQNQTGSTTTYSKNKPLTKIINYNSVKKHREALSKSNDANIPVINLDLIDTNSTEASTSSVPVLEQPISNSKIALSTTPKPVAIINLDNDSVLMKEQQLLISSLNQNLDITLSALEKSKCTVEGDVIEID
ncbi:hypothetical protein RN001_001821 [Aquatica leii]|uniref:Transcriptional regulator ATRX n=1 Tax=Aquatica leii TaxID=1421715 RepID=A0AAN7PCD0_9COLE|nr:hypothetical protein RN001_001821 [Aquatica leii]